MHQSKKNKGHIEVKKNSVVLFMRQILLRKTFKAYHDMVQCASMEYQDDGQTNDSANNINE